MFWKSFAYFWKKISFWLKIIIIRGTYDKQHFFLYKNNSIKT